MPANDGNFLKAVAGENNVYNVKTNFNGINECSEKFPYKRNYISSQISSTPYYDTCNYTFDGNLDFASDHRYLSTEVSTSEELFWAVENGVTPIITDTASRAYRIYREAKGVLNDIISPSMSDAEKALSIFDWIAVNSVYDNDAYYSNSVYMMQFPCYYLEGVFDGNEAEVGYAVCDGFAKSFSLLCNMVGLDTIRVVGTANMPNGSSGGHAWNKILIDKNPTDNVPAEYYMVDITWTELEDAGGQILSHKYFLVDDNYEIDGTHEYYKNRKKFTYYESSEMYAFYDEFEFGVSGNDYDLVVNQDSDLSPVFDYIFTNNIDNMEIIVDYDYLVNKYLEDNPSISVYDPRNDVEIFVNGKVTYYSLRLYLNELFRDAKIAEQYLSITYSSTTIPYNEKGDKGFIYVFSQSLLIDSDGEVEHLVRTLDDKGTEGYMTLYIYDTFLGSVPGSNYVARAENLFKSYLEASNISISFELLGNDNISGNKAHVYKIFVEQN